MKFDDLPPTPARPHNFFALPSVEVPVTLPLRQAPIHIHCKVAGKGRPLLLIHGLMTSGYSFRYIVPALAEHYQVFVPDLPGAGRSGAPLDLSMSPQSMAEFISCLISTLQIEPPYLVGNSLGGYQALWFAVLFPDQVRKLIVMHAPGFRQFGALALQWLLAVHSGRQLMRWMMCRDPEGFAGRNIHYYDPYIMSREEAREYGSIFRDQGRTEVFIRILRESLAAGAMPELEERLLRIRDSKGTLAPIRLLWARQDAMVPPGFGLKYQKLLPTAELVWIDQVSHFIHVDDPERAVQEILRFDEAPK
jgi:pimeloyl-ACP methyl ester carboxylesterase